MAGFSRQSRGRESGHWVQWERWRRKLRRWYRLRLGSFGGEFTGLPQIAPGPGHGRIDFTLGHFIDAFFFGILPELCHGHGQLLEQRFAIFRRASDDLTVENYLRGHDGLTVFQRELYQAAFAYTHGSAEAAGKGHLSFAVDFY